MGEEKKQAQGGLSQLVAGLRVLTFFFLIRPAGPWGLRPWEVFKKAKCEQQTWGKGKDQAGDAWF